MAGTEAGSHNDGSSDREAVGGGAIAAYGSGLATGRKRLPATSAGKNRFIGPLKFLFQIIQIYVCKSRILQLCLTFNNEVLRCVWWLPTYRVYQ
jgi:hypothetical protein